MIERVGQVVRLRDGGSTTINFTIDGVAAVASFPVSLTGVAAAPSLLTSRFGTLLPLTLGPTDSPPPGYHYSCFGEPVTCRPPSPDYGPTFSLSARSRWYARGAHSLLLSVWYLGVATLQRHDRHCASVRGVRTWHAPMLHKRNHSLRLRKRRPIRRVQL